MQYLITFLNLLLVVVSVFLIGLVLIQRGRGGGLAGAFGGAGGSSAFGTKAGDVFTRITIGVAAVWIVLCMLLVMLANRSQSTSAFSDLNSSAVDSPGDKDKDDDGHDHGKDKGGKGEDKGSRDPETKPIVPAPGGAALPDPISDAPAPKAADGKAAEPKAP